MQHSVKNSQALITDEIFFVTGQSCLKRGLYLFAWQTTSIFGHLSSCARTRAWKALQLDWTDHFEERLLIVFITWGVTPSLIEEKVLRHFSCKANFSLIYKGDILVFRWWILLDCKALIKTFPPLSSLRLFASFCLFVFCFFRGVVNSDMAQD